MREKREVSIPGVTHRSTAYHSLICPARRRRWRPRPPPTGYYFACPFVLSASERSKPVPRRGIVEGIANTTEYPGVRSQGDASVRASALCSAVPPFLRVIVCRSVFVPFLRVPSSDRNTHNLLRRHRSWLFSTENWNCVSLRLCHSCRGRPRCGKTVKIRVKNREPLPSYAMEISDEYQDMGNPGGGVAVVNIPITHHQRTPDSPLSHQEEDLSDPDLQDEESGEELPQQPLHGNTHSSSDNASAQANTPTPLTHLNSLMGAHHPHFLTKLKMEAADMDALTNKSGLEALQVAMSGAGFNLPFSFPPPAAFLTPQQHSQNSHSQTSNAIVSGIGNQMTSSASSHSSESSQGSGRNGGEPRETSNHSQSNSTGANQQQQTSWSFEEQFKQLYEINEDPKRKEFLDDLFSYMQKRGTPINRLPIMAKSVLDLYELYNLVIARGGLVDVINKKLWQEIIKGLHLPSSITSAAFTLRTQYMKYLYPYECEKRRLSTPAELQAAIDGNRREGRRSSYGTYATSSSTTSESLAQRNPHTPNSLALHAQMSPLSLVTAVAAGGQHHGPQSLVNGSAAHTPLPHHPHHPQHSQGIAGQSNAGPIPGMAPSEFEARMVEYVKLLNKELRSAGGGTPPPVIHRQDSASPPPSTPPRDGAFSALEMSRLTLWNMYNNNTLYPGMAHQPPMSPQASHSPVPAPPTPEPQREALDLGLRSSPICLSPMRRSSSPSSGGSMQIKKDQDIIHISGPPPAKRLLAEDDSLVEKGATAVTGTHIKISNRGDGRNGDNSLVVSMELNGVMYQGVLFAQSDSRTTNNTPTCSSSNSKPSRSMVS